VGAACCCQSTPLGHDLQKEIDWGDEAAPKQNQKWDCDGETIPVVNKVRRDYASDFGLLVKS
jgi:hypothetical protein